MEERARAGLLRGKGVYANDQCLRLLAPPLVKALHRRGNPAAPYCSLRATEKGKRLINIGTADRPVGARRGWAHQGSVRGQEEDESGPDRDQEEVA
jgi:hypothetical protein